jgi:hypothetical protein
MADDQNAGADGYYDEETGGDEELDLSFLDDKEDEAKKQ